MFDRELLDRLLGVFRMVFEVEQIDENTTTDDIENWDSLKQIELMIACEQEFDVHFNMKEIINAVSVKDILQILTEKKGN